MLIKCPNCNRDTVDDYKCQYCKYVINPKTHNYEKEIYEYLKTDYLNSRNKVITIKNGMEKYNKSMKEIKEIVDYIANEVYDIENFKSKEELDAQTSAERKSSLRTFKKSSLLLLIMSIISAVSLIVLETKYDNNIISMTLLGVFLASISMFAFSLKPEKIRKKNTFYYSFVQYFIHDMVYKIILLGVLSYIPACFKELFFKGANITLALIWYFALFFLFIYFLFKWAESSTSSVTVDVNKVSFNFKKSNPALHGEQIERFYHLAWSNHVEYNIQSITNVVETVTSIVIYGKITRKQSYVRIGGLTENYAPKEYEKIVIRKCFKNNKELIRKLKNKAKYGQ